MSETPTSPSPELPPLPGTPERFAGTRDTLRSTSDRVNRVTAFLRGQGLLANNLRLFGETSSAAGGLLGPVLTARTTTPPPLTMGPLTSFPPGMMRPPRRIPGMLPGMRLPPGVVPPGMRFPPQMMMAPRMMMPPSMQMMPGSSPMMGPGMPVVPRSATANTEAGLKELFGVLGRLSAREDAPGGIAQLDRAVSRMTGSGLTVEAICEMLQKIMAARPIVFEGFNPADPSSLERFFRTRNITPNRYASWIERMVRGTERLESAIGSRDSWRTGDKRTIIDGDRVWAELSVDGRVVETAFATAGQVFFRRDGQRTLPRGEGTPPIVVETASGRRVSWTATANGHRYTLEDGSVMVYERNSGGSMIERRIPGQPGRPLSMTYVDDEGNIVTRVNRPGGTMPGSASIDDPAHSTPLTGGIRRPGTYFRSPEGATLGPARVEVRRRGYAGLISALAAMPMDSVTAYISSNVIGQSEGPYSLQRGAASLDFQWSNEHPYMALMRGRGGCAQIAVMLAHVRQAQGANVQVIAVDTNHVACVELIQVGTGTKAVVYDSVGYHDDLPVQPNPAAALAATWHGRGRRPAVDVINSRSDAPELRIERNVPYNIIAGRMLGGGRRA